MAFGLDSRALTLYQVPDGTLALTAQNIDITVNDPNRYCALYMGAGCPLFNIDRLMPDGHGGLLLASGARWDGEVDSRAQTVARLANGSLSAWVDLDYSEQYRYWGTSYTDYVIGDDGAYLLTTRTTSGDPVQHLVKFDPVTLAVEWSDGVIDSPNARLRFAAVGGGVFYSGPNYYGNGQQVGPGVFASWSGGPMLQTGVFTLALTEFPQPRAEGGRNAAPPRFSTADAAAAAALARVVGQSVRTKLELGGQICRVPDGSARPFIYSDAVSTQVDPQTREVDPMASPCPPVG
ncbi:MAG TPA: hypothetical protein VF898_14465, partial [Chloroflexota bacterium]